MAEDTKNPYVNKNITNHTKEFLTFEIISDFHKGVEKYNNERGDLPEAKLVDNFYEIVDGTNKITFNINLALKGDYFYNGELSNVANKKSATSISFFKIFINEAQAADANMSRILLAAIIKLEESVYHGQMQDVSEARTHLVDKIKALNQNCSNYQYEETGNAPSDFQKILENIYSKANIGNEEKIVNNNLHEFVEPNCENRSAESRGFFATIGSRLRDQRSKAGDLKTFRADQNTTAANGIVDQDGNSIALSEAAKRNANADQEVCTQLAVLKSCLVTKTSYSANKSREYLKDKADDLRVYAPANDGNGSGKAQ